MTLELNKVNYQFPGINWRYKTRLESVDPDAQRCARRKCKIREQHLSWCNGAIMVMFVFFVNTYFVYWTYWKSTHVRHFKALRLRVTKSGALQVLKWEKAFRAHSSTEDASPTCKTSHFTSDGTGRRAGFHDSSTENRQQRSSLWTFQRPSAAPSFPRSSAPRVQCASAMIRGCVEECLLCFGDTHQSVRKRAAPPFGLCVWPTETCGRSKRASSWESLEEWAPLSRFA